MIWFKASQLIKTKDYEELKKYLQELSNPDEILMIACREIATEELAVDSVCEWDRLMTRANEIYTQTKEKVGTL